MGSYANRLFQQDLDLHAVAFGVDHRYPRKSRIGKIKYRFAAVQTGQDGCPIDENGER